MPEIELPSLAIVALYLVVLVSHEGAPALRRLAVLAACGILAEHTVVGFYDFYTYSPRWSVFVGNVPLLVGVIWPVVIDSARRIATAVLGEDSPSIPLLTGAIVAADAGLIEPIAVAADLWWWHVPGLFDVPVIGMLGWGIFAYWATRILGRPTGFFGALIRIAVATAATHVALVASWTLGLRFLARELPTAAGIVPLWAACLAAAAALRGRPSPLRYLAVRGAAAGFFFVLLVLHGEGLAIWIWSLAFPLPYLALLTGKRSG